MRKAEKPFQKMYYRSIYMNEASDINVTLQKAAEKFRF